MRTKEEVKARRDIVSESYAWLKESQVVGEQENQAKEISLTFLHGQLDILDWFLRGRPDLRKHVPT